MMEERGLGTKATRADIIQKLFDRGYVYGNPPIPSETGIAMYEAFKNYVPAMATPEMTAQLEAEMDRIAAGEMTKGAVVGESRDLLHKTWTEIDESREDLAKVVWKGMDEDRILGPCKVCEEAGPQEGGRLAQHAADHPREKIGQTLRRLQRLDPRRPRVLRPDLPAAPARRRLQARGALLDLRADAAAESRQPFRGRPWNLCLNDDCESMQEMKKRRAEREAAKAAKEAMAKKPLPERRRGRRPRRTAKRKAIQASQGGHAPPARRKRAKAGGQRR